MRFKTSLIIFIVTISSFLNAQTAIVYGRITDVTNEQSVDLATIYIKETQKGVSSDESGRYSIQVPVNQRLNLIIRRVGYKETQANVLPLSDGARYGLDISMVPSVSTIEAVIRERRLDEGGMVREKNMKDLKLLPTTTGNLESVLPHIALGTNAGTGGELSSQYQVRGGNYDENLVYVNDFEIYRPQLIRAGQQEGLTFANIDLMRDLSFSSGGFQAKYGDKLSSVLDIKYKRPDSVRASIGLSFLGGTAHIEGSLKSKKDSYRTFRYLVGARYKTTQSLLGSLDVKGEYNPNFTDVQTYLTYDLNRDWQIGFLGNFNRSQYKFIPESGNTAFGQINFALRLRTAYEGQEVDDFTNAMGGLSLTFLPERKHNPLYHKLLASGFRSQENERFDILGYYILGEIEENLGSSEFGDIVNILGTGTQHTWVRNYLTADVRNIEYKGGIELQKNDETRGLDRSHFIQWSLKVQNESIFDKINEWERIDSALYSLPYDTTQLLVKKLLKTKNSLQSNRINASLQDTWTWRSDGVREVQMTAGVRGTYWDLNKDYSVSPRIQMLYKPLNTVKDIAYRFATGLYYQPAFYREMRRLDGTVNKDLSAQKSAHVVGGFTYDFLWGKRRPTKMRLITELYYKKMWDLVSFDLDNVRVRYSGENNATGYATGLDLRLNGEFVPNAESWINISLLRTREKLNGIQHYKREVGDTTGIAVKDVARPTDRLMNVSMFFQDYLRDNKNVKMHLNLTFGSGTPFGVPDKNTVYRNTYRFTPYHRVDIGFAVLLWKEDWLNKHPKHFLRFTRNTWLSLEVFNLLKVKNKASNTWIKAINNTQYAIPNYLTGRRINLRLKVDF
jgi:CarboxypepD_reg-like domain/TonB-dependent Receptor Plug Domain